MFYRRGLRCLVLLLVIVGGHPDRWFCWAGTRLERRISTSGDGRSLRWDRFDVTINNMNTAQNTFDVSQKLCAST